MLQNNLINTNTTNTIFLCVFWCREKFQQLDQVGQGESVMVLFDFAPPVKASCTNKREISNIAGSRRTTKIQR